MAEDPGAGTLTTFYANWGAYQALLIKALAPLSSEQLGVRSAPHLRTAGSLAMHIIGARANWYHGFLGERDDDVSAFRAWNQPDAPLPSAAELISGLETTWRALQNALARWSPADLAQVVSATRRGQEYSASRQWVIWHLIEHDLHHGGEFSLTLGMHNIPALDL